MPLTAREKYRDDFGASGTSNGSGRSVHSAAPLGATAPAAPPGPNARVRSGSRHLKAAPKAGRGKEGKCEKGFAEREMTNHWHGLEHGGCQ